MRSYAISQTLVHRKSCAVPTCFDSWETAIIPFLLGRRYISVRFILFVCGREFFPAQPGLGTLRHSPVLCGRHAWPLCRSFGRWGSRFRLRMKSSEEKQLNLQKWASGFTIPSLILRISTITAGVVSQDQPAVRRHRKSGSAPVMISKLKAS